LNPQRIEKTEPNLQNIPSSLRLCNKNTGSALLFLSSVSIIMTDKDGHKKLLSVPGKADKRAAALRENLKRRKKPAKNKTDEKSK